MHLTEMKIKQFRNLSAVSIAPDPNINIIYGDNAQGKTNLIEAIWLFTGNTGFRSNKTQQLVQFDASFAENQITFQTKEREQTAMMRLGAKTEAKLNHVPIKAKSKFAGHFYGVIFSPDDLDFVKGSPKIRRHFLDQAISQITPQYLDYLEQYEKNLEQRNALLRDFRQQSLLEIWDLQLAKLGTILTIYRADYLKKLHRFAKDIYQGISAGTEHFGLFYQSGVFESAPKKYDDEAIDSYYQRLHDNIENDKKQGYTTIGVHRDDILMTINDRSAKEFGSQGQQRSSILTVKLSEAKLLQAVTGEMPIILLDDVMSELDGKRQDYILNHVKQGQVFITCCDIYNTIRLREGKIFRVINGNIQQMGQEDD